MTWICKSTFIMWNIFLSTTLLQGENTMQAKPNIVPSMTASLLCLPFHRSYLILLCFTWAESLLKQPLYLCNVGASLWTHHPSQTPLVGLHLVCCCCCRKHKIELCHMIMQWNMYNVKHLLEYKIITGTKHSAS